MKKITKRYERSCLEHAPSHGGDLVILGRILKSKDFGFKVLVVDLGGWVGEISGAHIKDSKSIQISNSSILNEIDLSSNSMICLNVAMELNSFYQGLIDLIRSSEEKIELILPDQCDLPVFFVNYLKTVSEAELKSIFIVLGDRADNELIEDFFNHDFSVLRTPFPIVRNAQKTEKLTLK